MASTRRTVSIRAPAAHELLLWRYPSSSPAPHYLVASDPPLRCFHSPLCPNRGQPEEHAAPPSHLVSPLHERFFAPLSKQ